MKGILHIQLFAHLIKADGSFGHVEIKPFLLNNFKNVETERSRVEMNRFLNLLTSENYIEFVNQPQTKGIKVHVENGRFIPSNEISAIVRIKPKAIELYNSYINNENNRKGLNKTIIISGIAVVVSFFGIFTPLKEKESLNLNILINKMDSIQKVNSNLQEEIYQMKLKYIQLERNKKNKE